MWFPVASRFANVQVRQRLTRSFHQDYLNYIQQAKIAILRLGSITQRTHPRDENTASDCNGYSAFTSPDVDDLSRKTWWTGPWRNDFKIWRNGGRWRNEYRKWYINVHYALTVTKDVVRFSNLLELHISSLFLIFVWVVFQRQLSIPGIFKRTSHDQSLSLSLLEMKWKYS